MNPLKKKPVNLMLDEMQLTALVMFLLLEMPEIRDAGDVNDLQNVLDQLEEHRTN